MSDKKTEKAVAAAPELKPVPDNIPEELLPVYDWYMGKGKDHLLYAAILLVVVLAVMAVFKYRDNRNMEASYAMMGADGVESFEGLNAKYGSTAVGPVISLRLAQAYFEAGNFEKAAEVYGAFAKKRSRHLLAPQARLGYAASLESARKFEEAKVAYGELAKDTASLVYPEATLGYARCLAALGDKAAASDLLDRLAIDKKDTRWEDMAENLRGVIERFDGFKPEFELNIPAAEEVAEPAPAPAEEAAAPVAEEAAPAPEAAAPAPAAE